MFLWLDIMSGWKQPLSPKPTDDSLTYSIKTAFQAVSLAPKPQVFLNELTSPIERGPWSWHNNVHILAFIGFLSPSLIPPRCIAKTHPFFIPVGYTFFEIFLVLRLLLVLTLLITQVYNNPKPTCHSHRVLVSDGYYNFDTGQGDSLVPELVLCIGIN